MDALHESCLLQVLALYVAWYRGVDQVGLLRISLYLLALYCCHDPCQLSHVSLLCRDCRAELGRAED